jgi:hypothetical protein
MAQAKEKVNIQTEKVDSELEQFRNLMSPPDTFEDGFNWRALAGALFIALIMVPGAIYMGLLAGNASIGPAAQWVTVILFVEIARRAQQQLKQQEIYILFIMAGLAMGAPFGGLLWNQFFINSDAAAAIGITTQLPWWFAPSPDSPSYAARTFMHADWFPVLGMITFNFIIGNLSYIILGYGLFRITSDVEKLPFPMAPIQAQGILALAEDAGDKDKQESGESWRWRVFSIGGALGLGFGAIYYLLPTLTAALTNMAPLYIFPIPFKDLTSFTKSYLPAVPTGINWDLGLPLYGMVMPFFAVLGKFIGMVLTIIANPILYKFHVLQAWKPGDDTIVTSYSNYLDFYFSFSIGLLLSVAAFGFFQIYKGMKKKKREAHPAEVADITIKAKQRGDIKPVVIIATYFVVTMIYILVSGSLIGWHTGVLLVLIFFGFVYTPVISYVTARLEGTVGQSLEIPFIRDAAFILSNFQGIKVWFLPIPQNNYGGMTVQYRVCELTGTRFTSLWKSQIILYPIILVSSFMYMNFIWSLAPVPSAVYPFANKMWELQAAQQCVMYSATLGEYSKFQDAFRPEFLSMGFGLGTAIFAGFSALGWPIMLMYGIVGSIGGMMHDIFPQFLGAMIGRFYFHKKMGLTWLQYVPIVTAGYSCGVGLITTLGIGITFMNKAVIQLNF